MDQGGADNFLVEQLKPELLEAACANAGQRLNSRRQEGYDHSYFFVSSFIGTHLALACGAAELSTRPRVLTRRWTAEVEQYLAERFDVTVNELDTPLDAAALAAAMQSHDALCPTVTDQHRSAAVLDGA